MPSFNKENFKNFQSNYNRTQTTPIIHSTFHCVKEYSESQIIVNQKYNIVVKYLEETDNNNNNSLLNINKKRELFNNTEACSSTNNNNNQEINAESGNESKSFKKLRSSSPNIDSRNISTDVAAAAATTSNQTSSYFIEIDES